MQGWICGGTLCSVQCHCSFAYWVTGMALEPTSKSVYCDSSQVELAQLSARLVYWYDECCCAQATSKEQSIRIASSGGLSEDQIQNMVREAEANAEKDKSVSLVSYFCPQVPPSVNAHCFCLFTEHTGEGLCLNCKLRCTPNPYPTVPMGAKASLSTHALAESISESISVNSCSC